MATTLTDSRTKVAEYERELEALWSIWDTLLDRITPSLWNRRYGKDWTYADVPYHIAYFDRLLVCEPIEYGRDMPREKQLVFDTMGTLNAWNDSQFAQRKPGQTPQESIAEMHAQRERLRGLLRGLTDADLAKPAYTPFFDEHWTVVEEGLAAARQHAWSEGWELAQRLGARDVQFPESVIHKGLAAYLRLMAVFAEPEAARRVGSFAAVWEISGPGGGTWTVRLRDGRPSTVEGRADAPDVTIRLSTDTWMAMFKKTANPMLLMLSGKMRVKGMRRFGTFGKVFAEPPLDRKLTTGGMQSFLSGLG